MSSIYEYEFSINARHIQANLHDVTKVITIIL